jgi:sigma-B regulation protein RsbU (phosphoserine phosphatase)
LAESNHQPVILLGPGAPANLSGAVTGHWPVARPGVGPSVAPRFEVADIRALAISAEPWPEAASASLLLLPGPPGCVSPADLRVLAARAEDRSIPMVVLGEWAKLPASVIALPAPSASNDHAALAAALSALLQRQHELGRLRRQLTLEHRLKAAAGQQLGRFHDEFHLAATLQRAFLPGRLPEVPGVALSHLFRPVGDLSGDIYDATQLDERTLAFFVADACGHGLPAAMLTMLIGRMLPMKEVAGLATTTVPPGEALRRLNAQFMQRRASESALVTAMYGTLDLPTGQVTLAGAGHPPAAIVAGSTLRLVHSEGPAIGLFEDADFPTCRFTLEPGETLLLHTDGFEQAFVLDEDRRTRRRRPSELYRQNFVDLFGGQFGERLDDAMTAMSQRLDEQHGSLHQLDDITLLALARRAAAEAAEADDTGPGESLRAAA